MTKIKAFFKRVWAMCFRSLTIAWSYILLVIGAVSDQIDSIAAALGDPNLTAQIKTIFGDAVTYGKWLMVVAVVNIAARARSMFKKPD